MPLAQHSPDYYHIMITILNLTMTRCRRTLPCRCSAPRSRSPTSSNSPASTGCSSRGSSYSYKLAFCFFSHKYQKLDPQVQFPLSLVSIKYKHFLLFGIGGPILNTLIWFFLRLDDKEPLLGVDQEEMMGTKWENGTRSTLCLFFEDRSVDVYVMQVEISSVTPRTSRNSADTNARHPGLQHLLPHLGHPG